MKAVWKDLVRLDSQAADAVHVGTEIITSKLLDHVEWHHEGLNVWFETPQDSPAPEVHTLHAVLTGSFIPDSWEWIATARGPEGFVGHLYRSAREPY